MKRSDQRKSRVLALGIGVVALIAVPVGATSIPQRTLRASIAASGAAANGASQNPSLSPTGRIIAFDSTASNLGPQDANGAVRDVYTRDRETGRTLIASSGLGGVAADGSSSEPSVSGPANTVAFTSSATNLVGGDTNAKADIFVRDRAGGIARVSVGPAGEEANGDSSQPRLSEDGGMLAFVSEATNLVAGDTNGVSDVFVRDLASGRTRRVSVSSLENQANAASFTPAITVDGRYVTFASKASNLFPGDTAGSGDVFIRDVAAGRTEIVSISSARRRQNRSVIAPFTQISDVSRNGRYVVFDSDANNLVRGDRNKDTDVFLRDRELGKTTRISLAADDREALNDSFAPAITPDGRYVAFESFAENLAPGDAPREDVFVRDLRGGSTTVVTVSSQGAPRSPETEAQLLQQPVISSNGRTVAFVSTASNLTDGDDNSQRDVFLRLLDPPSGRLTHRPPRRTPTRHPVIATAADDPGATRALCVVNGGAPRVCSTGKTKLPTLRKGANKVKIYVGGPGMLFDSSPLSFSIQVRPVKRRVRRPTIRPTGPTGLRITSPRPRRGNRFSPPVRAITGTTREPGELRRVLVSVIALNARGCTGYNGRRFVKRPCDRPIFLPARGIARWRLTLSKPALGLVAVRARTVGKDGKLGPVKTITALAR